MTFFQHLAGAKDFLEFVEVVHLAFQSPGIAMSFQEYTDLSALFVIIFVTVMIIDYGSEKLRHRVIGMEERTS